MKKIKRKQDVIDFRKYKEIVPHIIIEVVESLKSHPLVNFLLDVFNMPKFNYYY